MHAMNYTCSFVVECPPMEAFDAIGRVRDWWTVNTDGSASAVGDEFTVQFGDVHLTTQHVVDAVAGRRMVWRVTRSHLPWLKDAEEWKDTEVIFDIAEEAAGTRITSPTSASLLRWSALLNARRVGTISSAPACAI